MTQNSQKPFLVGGINNLTLRFTLLTVACVCGSAGRIGRLQDGKHGRVRGQQRRPPATGPAAPYPLFPYQVPGADLHIIQT